MDLTESKNHFHDTYPEKLKVHLYIYTDPLVASRPFEVAGSQGLEHSGVSTNKAAVDVGVYVRNETILHVPVPCQVELNLAATLVLFLTAQPQK